MRLREAFSDLYTLDAEGDDAFVSAAQQAFHGRLPWNKSNAVCACPDWQTQGHFAKCPRFEWRVPTAALRSPRPGGG